MSDAGHFAIDAGDVEEEDVVLVKIDGQKIAIYNVDGEFFATSDTCTHGNASLSEGTVVDDVIECPLHQGRFCVRTGRSLGPPVSSPITSYPTKVEDGRVFVQVMGSENS